MAGSSWGSVVVEPPQATVTVCQAAKEPALHSANGGPRGKVSGQRRGAREIVGIGRRI